MSASFDFDSKLLAHQSRVIDQLKREIDTLRNDLIDAAFSLGVRYAFYNGIHRAWINGTTCDVPTDAPLTSEEEAREWVRKFNDTAKTSPHD